MVVSIWLVLIFSFVAAVLFVIPWGGSKYGQVVWELAGYLVWPFGKYVEELMEEDEDKNSPKSEGDLTHGDKPGELNQTGNQPSRWVKISEIDEDEVDSVGCLKIREGGSRDEESTPLTSNKNASKIPNYGTLNQESTNSHHESKEPLNSPSWYIDLDQVKAGPSNESGQGQLAQQSTNYYTPLDRTDDELLPRLKPGQASEED
ncbi:hypothetical protein BY996DRAFT_8458234 [Phakopsora pachyrhizi]|nr:hypothetical protein BY996DRAFT_8458234 [Phakopsora pachyrhizi]